MLRIQVLRVFLGVAVLGFVPACGLADADEGEIFAAEALSLGVPMKSGPVAEDGGRVRTATAMADAAPVGAAPVGGGVLLELFTSQGCSSCPPADRLLSELADDPDLAGRVFPLAFHVDYWNYLGWADPFSSARWSERQRRYANQLPRGRVYTPQLVIGGASHTVGSRRGEVRQRVERALREAPAGRLHVEVGEVAGDQVPVTVEARLHRVPDGGGPLVVWVALWQDGLVTPVGRGENADRVLRDDRVVRHLEQVLELPAEVGAHSRARVALPVEIDGPRENLGVVAFLQSSRDLRIHGVSGDEVPGR